MVRSVDVKLLTENIKEMCIQANHYLAPDMDKAMKMPTKKRQSLWQNRFWHSFWKIWILPEKI